MEVTQTLTCLAYIIIFPGLLFLIVYSLFCEWFDRKLYAKMQNRVGPPIFQPFADFIKLMTKEDVVPRGVNPKLVNAIPIFALAAVATAFLYLPIFEDLTLFSFQGDLIVVLYLLTLPSLCLFLMGWYSKNPYGVVGATRTLTQVFSYEVPFLISLLGPALLAGTWRISEIVRFQSDPAGLGYWTVLAQPIGFVVAVVSLQGKLERIPFDIPEAETEIVAGPLVDYTGRKIGFFRLVIDMEMVAGSGLIAALFLGGFTNIFGVKYTSFFIFIVLTLVIVFILSVIRTVFARLRIDQMVTIFWKYLVGLSLIQLLLAVVERMAMG